MLPEISDNMTNIRNQRGAPRRHRWRALHQVRDNIVPKDGRWRFHHTTAASPAIPKTVP